jgi:uncharacterized membrane protein YoaK (UPF0700 family)
MGAYTSHISGNAARIGDELAQGHRWAAGIAAAIVFFYFIGAAAATFFILRAKHLARARYSTPLLVEAAALTAFATAASHLGHEAHVLEFELTCLLSFAMGMQNAMVTKISGATIRTTHMTGIVTDIGIEAVRAVDWLRAARARTASSANPPSFFHLLRRDPQLKRLRLHLTIFSSFILGATLGPLTWLHAGRISIVFPVFAVLLLAIFDGFFGLPRPASEAKAAASPTAESA